MLHFMKLHPSSFQKIKSGTKTVELRLYDEKRQLIKPGDEIEFVNSDEQTQTVRVVVKGLYQYDSFEELYQHFTPIEMGYRPDQIACASPNDMDQYYSREKQQKYGALAIAIEVINA